MICLVCSLIFSQLKRHCRLISIRKSCQLYCTMWLTITIMPVNLITELTTAVAMQYSCCTTKTINDEIHTVTNSGLPEAHTQGCVTTCVKEHQKDVLTLISLVSDSLRLHMKAYYLIFITLWGQFLLLTFLRTLVSHTSHTYMIIILLWES